MPRVRRVRALSRRLAVRFAHAVGCVVSRHEDVQKALAKIARAAVGNAFALESVTVFDLYSGKGMADGKKSLAFNLAFRSADRTLTDDEVNAVFQKVQAELETSTPYQIRK